MKTENEKLDALIGKNLSEIPAELKYEFDTWYPEVDEADVIVGFLSAEDPTPKHVILDEKRQAFVPAKYSTERG